MEDALKMFVEWFSFGHSWHVNYQTLVFYICILKYFTNNTHNLTQIPEKQYYKWKEGVGVERW